MLNILGMIILIIILFIIILLYIGVKIAFIYDKNGNEFKGCLKILILKKIKVYSLDFPSEDDEEEEDEEKGEHDTKNIIKLIRPCLEDIREFVKSFTKCIKVSKLENHLIFGRSSYVDTAKYIGYIWSLFIIINTSHKNARMTAEPSFNGSRLDAKGVNELDINLLKLVPPAIKLISKKEVRELIKGVRNG